MRILEQVDPTHLAPPPEQPLAEPPPHREPAPSRSADHPARAERTDGQEPEHQEQPVVIPPDLPRITTIQVIIAAAAFVALLAGLFLLGFFPDRARAQTNADAAAARDRKPVVSVLTPQRQEKASELVLPADVQAYQYTAIFPRTNGYLKRLLVDIGDHVEANQLLAEIATPEVDAQLDQARANAAQARVSLVKAQTDLALAKLTYDRYTTVPDKRAVSQQDVDTARTQYEQAQANVDVAKATIESSDSEVHRLVVLTDFEKVLAPFAGTVTARNYDVGALLSPATTSGARELFQIARTDVLRAFINVPQSKASDVQVGQTADLLVRNFPGRAFNGTVTRTAGAVDPTTRTLRVQVDVLNPSGELFAGMYGQVRFQVTQSVPPFIVPTSALIYNAEGLHVAVVDDGKVHFQRVTVARDFGNELEIADGLTGSESVVSNPGERLSEGLAVQVAAPPADQHPAVASTTTEH